MLLLLIFLLHFLAIFLSSQFNDCLTLKTLKMLFTKENGIKAVVNISTVLVAMFIYQKFIAAHVAPKKAAVAAK